MQDIHLDYPIHPHPRYGHGLPPHPELHRLLEGGRGRYEAFCGNLMDYAAEFAAIPMHGSEPGQPTWINGFFGELDAMALYAFLRKRCPRQYVEIGSGNSTRFARKAVTASGGGTQITCIDPNPRVEVQGLADRIIRLALEDTDPAFIQDIQAGDILFFDGSHRCFTNSDVTVFFTELLPRIKPGVLVHIHDIFLPWDYPADWNPRVYSEQYLLACWLLAGGNQIQVEFPVAFIERDERLQKQLQRLRLQIGHEGLTTGGVSFWLTKQE